MHPNRMPHHEIIAEAEKLLYEHDLSDRVQVRMNPRLVKVYGRVMWTRPMWTLEMSTKLCDANDREETLNTIRHEVAHAIAGPRAKHGPAWKAACRLTGARPERCYTHDSVNPAAGMKWAGECGGCGKVVTYMTRKPHFKPRWHRPSSCPSRRRGYIVWVNLQTGERVDTARYAEPPSPLPTLGRLFDPVPMPVAASAPAPAVSKGSDTCKHGHELTEENTYTDPRGSKVCRQCKRDAAARHKAKKEGRA